MCHNFLESERVWISSLKRLSVIILSCHTKKCSCEFFIASPAQNTWAQKMVQLSPAVLLYKAHTIHRDERITFLTAPVLDPLSHLNTKLLV